MDTEKSIGRGKSSPLTDTQIRKAKPREKAYKLPDGSGLFLVGLRQAGS